MLPRFYPIFDHSDWIKRMLPLGVKMVQLRLKDTTESILRLEINKACDLCSQYNALLVVNDHWQHAIDLKCGWVHLGQEDLDSADIAAIRKAGIKLGISTHDDSELERALSLNPNYVALGPIYPTILKKMKWHQQGVGKLKVWKKRIGNIPLVAIGGMTAEKALTALESGADIVSAVTDITLNSQPELRVTQWLEVCR